MKTFSRWWMVVLLILTPPTAGWTGEVPSAGARLVPMQLEAPAEADQRAYLGLDDSEPFTPTDISGLMPAASCWAMA